MAPEQLNIPLISQTGEEHSEESSSPGLLATDYLYTNLPASDDERVGIRSRRRVSVMLRRFPKRFLSCGFKLIQMRRLPSQI